MTQASDSRKLLGDNVLALRCQRGYSQRQLASKIGTNQSVIWQIEKGLISTGFDTICRLADALDVKPKDLVNF